MCADDTTLTSAARDPHVLESNVNHDRNLIQSWLKANKLTLIVKKTKYVLIGSQQRLSIADNNFTVKVSNTPIGRKIEYTSVVVLTDEVLTWRPRINVILKKISASFAVLKRVSPTVLVDHKWTDNGRRKGHCVLLVPQVSQSWCSTHFMNSVV